MRDGGAGGWVEVSTVRVNRPGAGSYVGHMSQMFRLPLWISGAWLAGAAAVSSCWAFAPIAASLAMAAMYCVAIVLLVLFAVAPFADKVTPRGVSTGRFVVACAGLIAACVLAWFVVNPAMRSQSVSWRFQYEKSAYFAAFQPLATSSTHTIFTDDERPGAKYFVWGGVMDNSHGVVFDPTDSLAGVRPGAVFFGDRIVTIRRLEQNWYYVELT